MKSLPDVLTFEMETGANYILIDGVPYKLVTETEHTKDGVKSIIKYVPAKPKVEEQKG